MQYVKLSDGEGRQMPVVGLGTWRASPDEVERAVDIALECGYRHIDTAFSYNNEQAIGNTLKKWLDTDRLKREDLFITTKLPVFGNRASDVEKFLKLSLDRLKLNYVDLYLIHMPFAMVCDEETLQMAKNEDGTPRYDYNNNNIETWKVMEQQVKNKLTKSIGLSNFNLRQVDDIHKNAEIKPVVLQIELHAYLQQNELVDRCKELGIAITAYAPLGSPAAHKHFLDKYNFDIPEFSNLLVDPLVQELSGKYSKSQGQVLLKHLVQKGVIVIPKSGNADRIKENITLFDFELAPDDMKSLDKLDKGETGRIFTFLFFTGIDKHPQYPFGKPV